MITHSGVQMHPGCGRAPAPVDIAVAMCRITRYAGAVWCPLAAHSILVAEFLAEDLLEPEAWSWGLLHDAHETVTGELTRHYKPKAMKEFEAELDGEIFGAFALDLARYRGAHEAVKNADRKAMCAEALNLGLKGWPEYYRAREGRDIPELTALEEVVGRAVLGGWRSPEMLDAGSSHVVRLTAALELVAGGRHKEARSTLAVPPSREVNR